MFQCRRNSLPKLKIDGSFINEKVNIRQSNYYIIKSCKEYLSTKECISYNVTWQQHENLKKLGKGERCISHTTLCLKPGVQVLQSPKSEVRFRSTVELFHLVNLHSVSTETWALRPGATWLHIGNFSENWPWIYLPDPGRPKTFNRYVSKEERILKFFFDLLTTVNHPPWMSMPDSSLDIMEKVKQHSRKTDKFGLDVHVWTEMDLMISRVFFSLNDSIIP